MHNNAVQKLYQTINRILTDKNLTEIDYTHWRHQRNYTYDKPMEQAL